MKPFVKWAGGKTGLLPEIVSRLPETINFYIEPFLGGGSVFLRLLETDKINRAYLSDSNRSLINAWSVIKTSPETLIDELAMLKRSYSKFKTKDIFYRVQRDILNMYLGWSESDISPRERIDWAARFIFLNKTCFNGLFRTNSQGYFNVPFGRHKEFNFDIENIVQIHDAIKSPDIIFELDDFSGIPLEKKAFIYFDPPYATDSGFTTYSGQFGKKEQVRLAEFVKLAAKDNSIMVSNSFGEMVNDLYSGFTKHVVQAPRSINRDGKGRGLVHEFLITNYE